MRFDDPPFRWSGRNLHEARRVATTKLRNRLESQLRASPKPIQVVIAHSHAGNIALKALGPAPALCKNVLVITLATPFLRFEPSKLDLVVMPMIIGQIIQRFRPTWQKVWAHTLEMVRMLPGQPWARLLILAVIGVMYLVLEVWFFVYVFVPFTRLLPAGLAFACTALSQSPSCQHLAIWYSVMTALMLVLAGGLIGLVEARKYILSREGPRLVRERDEAIQRFSYFQPEEPLNSIRLRVMSSWLDEAMGALTGAWWLHRASVWLARLVALIGVLAAFGAAAAVAYAITTVFSAQWSELALDLALMLAALATIIVIPLVVVPIVEASSVLVVKLAQRVGLGVANVESGLLTSVSASRRPGQNIPHAYQQYHLWALLRGSTGFLFHSRLYSNPRAIQAMAKWVIDTSQLEVPLPNER